jgi:uncharacterized protein (TIGR03382 family)
VDASKMLAQWSAGAGAPDAGADAGVADAGSGEGGEEPLAVAPPTATVAAGATQAFTASGGSGAGYGWSLAANPSGGSIDASGLYMAGGTGGVIDTVTVTDSEGHTATRDVTVTAAPQDAPADPAAGNQGCGSTGSDGTIFSGLALLAVVACRMRRCPSGTAPRA